MTTILRSLIWKEFHELKWKAVALVVIAVGLPVVVRAGGRDLAGALSMLEFAVLPLGAVLVAMHVAVSESSRGTLALARALPVRQWKIMACKLALGIAASLLPVLALYILDVLVLDRHVWGSPVRWLTRAAPTTLCVYLWAAAAGSGRRTEWQAGVAAVIVYLGWTIYGTVASSFGTRGYWLAMYPSPLGFVLVSSPLGSIATLLVCQVPLLSALVLWSLSRFGRVPARAARTPRPGPGGTASDCGVSMAPRRSTLGALVWLQWRQLRSLCVVSVLSIPAITCLAVYGAYSREALGVVLNSSTASRAMEMLAGWSHFLGVFVAVLAAIGAFAEDLRPKIAAFWRSRPIPTGSWFLVKYLTGAAAVVGALSVPVLACSAAVAFVPDLPHNRYPALLLVNPPLHVLAFTLATCLVCVSRQPFYSGILASILSYAVICAPRVYESLQWMQLGQVMRAAGIVGGEVRLAWSLNVSGYLAYAGTLFGLTLPPLLVAWLAVKRRLR